MNHYIIDGNNLIGKIKTHNAANKEAKQQSRDRLVSLLNGYFAGKNCNLTLHLDGHPNTPLHLSKGRIVYSEKRTSDFFIRQEIDNSKNRKQIILVSSDHSLMNYAKVNSCTVVKSEDFLNQMITKSELNDESRAVKQLENDKNFFYNVFNIK